MNLTDHIKSYFQRIGWLLLSINLICLTIAIGVLQTQPFSPKARIVLYLIIIIFLYLVNYVSFILFSTKKILPRNEIQEKTTKRYRKGDYRMQNYLFPIPIDDENYEIYGRTLTYNPIGGDFYNFLTDPQGNYWIGIGDSVGHGYQAGIFSMMIFQKMALLVKYDLNPYKVIEDINEDLLKRTEQNPTINSNLYATFLLIKADKQGNIEHSGLHPSFVIYKKRTGENRIVETDGKFISTTMNACLKNVQSKNRFHMESGDIVFCFTDGLYEQKNNGNLYFGESLFRFLEGVPKNHLGKIADDLFTEILKHTNGRIQDDMTIVMIRKK
ncbi:PP2C family protein-serine/threonine phosphatase [Leptospira mayottensis]|uniref:Stage II sporulation protein E n=2 Tax=Leptospira mayottensis TaxID=1137606 RepID=A0AA87SYI2_9LEPT|nr:PP2C family protein-serine/threonine phosphatase [Leptospira mayottensis]AXR61315.1 serine/threonine-protein phosphatase [Leptospira mayottensis]AXR65429.1 serine/threonine-protein phosphatase [Leptospira mayottensis]AZQ02248.1 serine/threonine-protein phosphatase [Leptospira mayottensis 200901116]EKR99346.1 stage II sporulation protein E [Leptospira mayottensis 200901122]TGM94437.1 serine/threonine-protein phosphatase [Leptospira mayottensis]